MLETYQLTGLFEMLETYPWMFVILAIVILTIIIIYMNYNEKIVEKFQVPQIEIVNYYATWCGHSRAFLSAWDEFVKKCNEKYPNVKTYSVICNASTGEEICKKKGIEAYPTVVLYVGNEAIKFESYRTVENLLNFVKNNLPK